MGQDDVHSAGPAIDGVSEEGRPVGVGLLQQSANLLELGGIVPALELTGENHAVINVDQVAIDGDAQVSIRKAAGESRTVVDAALLA